jgi:hypothetical protein
MQCMDGHDVDGAAKFCSECGAPVVPLTAVDDPTASTVHDNDTPSRTLPSSAMAEAHIAPSHNGSVPPKGRKFATIALVAVALLLAGGGLAAALLLNDSDKPRDPKAVAAAEEGGVDVGACREEIGEFVGVLGEVNSRLDVGLDVSEFGSFLGDAKVAYDDINYSAAVEVCDDLAGDAEEAYNAYITSLNDWQDCISSSYCTPATPKMQRNWSKAAGLIDDIEAALGS